MSIVLMSMIKFQMEQIIDFLRNGGIVVHNTDTCVGFAADILNELAVDKVYSLKQMSKDKPVSILCSDLEMAQQYGVFPEKALELAKMYLPGALTIIVPRTGKVPYFLNPGAPGIGIRIPNDEFSLAMVREFGSPVTTTSCNISGQKVCTSVVEVCDMFEDALNKGEIVIAFDGHATQKVSTVVRVDGDEVEILRQGEIKID